MYLVFEHMKGTILDSLKDNHRYRGTLGLPNDVVKSIVLQCLQCVSAAVIEKQQLVEWFAENYKKWGAKMDVRKV